MDIRFCIKDNMKKLPFIDKLTDAEKQLVYQCSSIRDYAKNSGINAFSKACLGMIYVIKGSIRVYIISEDGREITLFHINADNCCILSASCVINDIGFDVQLMAGEDTQLLAINAGAVKKLMDCNIEFRCYAYELSTNRLSAVVRSIKEILFDHFDVRLARVLLALYEKNGKKNIKITQELLAQEVNSAREVVTRMLKTFAMKGWLEVNRGCIVLKDIEALTELSNK